MMIWFKVVYKKMSRQPCQDVWEGGGGIDKGGAVVECSVYCGVEHRKCGV